MNRIFSHTKQKLFFSRWSAKGYAAFASMGKEVSIGQLNVRIVEQADRLKAILVDAAGALKHIFDLEEESEDACITIDGMPLNTIGGLQAMPICVNNNNNNNDGMPVGASSINHTKGLLQVSTCNNPFFV